MLIFGENLKPHILENVDDPLLSDYYWTLNLGIKDFIFDNVGFLFQQYEKGIGFSFDGQYVEIPQSWYILVMDPIHGDMDLVLIDDVRGRVFDAFVYDHDAFIPQSASMTMKNSRVYKKFCYPIFDNNLMLVHPISERQGIVITPHNSYKKLKDLNVLDFFE